MLIFREDILHFGVGAKNAEHEREVIYAALVPKSVNLGNIEIQYNIVSLFDVVAGNATFINIDGECYTRENTVDKYVEKNIEKELRK